MLFKKKPQVSRPLPELGHQDAIVYLQQIIQHVEVIRSGKGGVTKDKADLGLNILLNGISNAWESYEKLSDDDLYEQKTAELIAFVVEKAGPNTPLGQWFSKKEQTQANYAELMAKFGAAPVKQEKSIEKPSQKTQSKAFIDPKKALLDSVEHVIQQQKKIYDKFRSFCKEMKPSTDSPKEPEKNISSKNTPR